MGVPAACKVAHNSPAVLASSSSKGLTSMPADRNTRPCVRPTISLYLATCAKQDYTTNDIGRRPWILSGPLHHPPGHRYRVRRSIKIYDCKRYLESRRDVSGRSY